MMIELEAAVTVPDMRSRFEVLARTAEEGEAAVGKMSHLPLVVSLRRTPAVGSVEAWRRDDHCW